MYIGFVSSARFQMLWEQGLLRYFCVLHGINIWHRAGFVKSTQWILVWLAEMPQHHKKKMRSWSKSHRRAVLKGERCKADWGNLDLKGAQPNGASAAGNYMWLRVSKESRKRASLCKVYTEIDTDWRRNRLMCVWVDLRAIQWLGVGWGSLLGKRWCLSVCWVFWS